MREWKKNNNGNTVTFLLVLHVNFKLGKTKIEVKVRFI